MIKTRVALAKVPPFSIYCVYATGPDANNIAFEQYCELRQILPFAPFRSLELAVPE
jgi:hypothetical protein